MSFGIISFLKGALPGRPAVPVADDQPLPVVIQSVPVGGGYTWGAITAVAMTGSSVPFVPANASRKALRVWSPSGNAPAAYDLSGGAATLASGAPLLAGSPGDVYTGADTPVGAITAIGTNTQNLYYQQGA